MKQAIILLLLILPIALATNNITTSETTITLEGETAKIENTMKIYVEDHISNLTLVLTENAQKISIQINNQTKKCLVQADFARCGNLTTGTHNIKIDYQTTYPIAKNKENLVIRYTDKLPYQADNQEVTLKLPIGYIIPREQGKDEDFYISPKPNEVYSDGQRIILNWKQKGQELPISVVTRTIDETPRTLIATVIIAVIVIIGWLIHYIRKRPKTKIIKKKIIVPTLIDNEQQVVEFLKTNGQVWQKQIQTATGFSKAKVSRVVRNLEARGVITKTPYGNTNKIELKLK